jgi:hypothetical protein
MRLIGISLLTVAISIPLAAQEQAPEYSLWSIPQSVGSIVNSPFNDQHPAISKDGLSLYFASDRPGGYGDFDLYVSQRASLDDPWEPPINLGANINTSGRDLAPAFSPDGHRLYFHRPGLCGGLDLFVSVRKDRHDDFAWEPAENLGCDVNSAFNDAGPTFFGDEAASAVLYFTSLSRPGGLGDFDIYRSRLRDDGTWGPGELMVDLSSSSRDTRTAIRRDGLEMFISTERPGGAGSSDLWVSTRPDTTSGWDIPINVVTEAPPGTDAQALINTKAFEGAPALSWDAKTLYFYSTRPGVAGNNDADLYISTRTIRKDR